MTRSEFLLMLILGVMTLLLFVGPREAKRESKPAVILVPKPIDFETPNPVIPSL